MEKYFKMSDVFFGAKPEDFHINPVCIRENFDDGVTPHNHAIHAINSHDGLVAMNKELLAALEAVIEWYDMEADHSIEPDFYKRMAACQVSEDMAREAIAKAKGTA